MQETVLQKIPAAFNDGTKIKVSRGHSVTRVLKMGVNGAAHTRHVFLGSPTGPIHSKILKTKSYLSKHPEQTPYF